MTTVKTMQALNELIGYCTGYGGKYNPGRQNLRIENLQVQLEAVRQLRLFKVSWILPGIGPLPIRF